MLRALGPRDSVKASAQRTGKWLWSTGTDYYHLEDIDTAMMTQEEYQDFRRLTETPLSVWMRVKHETVSPMVFRKKPRRRSPFPRIRAGSRYR